ncbi:MAG: hypothetical protein U0031_02845 [Thermomicrobiales bacterium]
MDDDIEWAYRFLMVDVRADAEASEQTRAINAAWEEIADELWTPQIVSFQAVPLGDYLSLVVLYRYDDSDDDDDDDDE